VAEDHAKGPVVQDEQRDEGRGHAEEGHQDVAQGQAGYKVIGDCAHAWRGLNDIANGSIADQGEDKDGNVEHINKALEVDTGPQVLRLDVFAVAAKVHHHGDIIGVILQATKCRSRSISIIAPLQSICYIV